MADSIEYAVKASVSRHKRIKCIIVVGILAVVSCFGLVMAVYNLFCGDFLLFLYYIVAAVLGISYIVIKLNIIFPTYIAADEDYLYMNNWENGFLPYDIYYGKGFIRDFVPAKTKNAKVELDQIQEVLLGSKLFVKRYCCENVIFNEKIGELENFKDINKKKNIRNMDLFCVITKQCGCYLMPVSGFDENQITMVLNYIEKKSKAVIKCNNKSIKQKRRTVLTGV